MVRRHDSPKILIVDDDAVAREKMTRALHLAGHADVNHAATVEMAGRRLEGQGPFALVILSVRLPDESGLALLERLAPLAPQTVVIMVTVGHGLLTAIDCLKRGAYDYILKPVDAEGIQLSVGLALKRRERELAEIERHRQVEELVGQRLSMLEETRSALIRAICRLAEFGTPGPHVHPERVARYSQTIAGELARRSPYAPFVGLDFLHNIPEAALLHDVGKLSLPASLLRKPGKLTPEEQRMLESHTTVGQDICLSVMDQLRYPDESFIRMAADVTSAHHERWDGGGYPEGLRGSGIPLSARIVGLADYYDVWRMPQAYRPDSLPAGKVAAMIYEQSGAKFDPVVVEAFRRSRVGIGRAERELAQEPCAAVSSQPSVASSQRSAVSGQP
jgi:putative two-component system response regulator